MRRLHSISGIVAFLISTQTIYSGCPAYPPEVWTGKLVACSYKFPKKEEILAHFNKGIDTRRVNEEIKKHEGLIFKFEMDGVKRLVFCQTVEPNKCAEFPLSHVYQITSRKSCGMAFEAPYAWGFHENVIQLQMKK